MQNFLFLSLMWWNMRSCSIITPQIALCPTIIINDQKLSYVYHLGCKTPYLPGLNRVSVFLCVSASGWLRAVFLTVCSVSVSVCSARCPVGRESKSGRSSASIRTKPRSRSTAALISSLPEHRRPVGPDPAPPGEPIGGERYVTSLPETGFFIIIIIIINTWTHSTPT